MSRNVILLEDEHGSRYIWHLVGSNSLSSTGFLDNKSLRQARQTPNLFGQV
jgi:hypothetical protein